MEGISYPTPRTVDEIFNDYKGRRSGLIKALTTDVDKFYQQCDPEEENLCLYGLPNETWELNSPDKEVPPHLPEPALGINFARDGMRKKDWLSLIAVHSDLWLLAVAFYFVARVGFGKNERERLFQMINDLPTLFEVVTGTGEQPRNQSAKRQRQSSATKSPRTTSIQYQIKEIEKRKEGIPHRKPRTVDEVFNDFNGGRSGLIKALITEKANLCLYGLPTETWEVNLPDTEVPPDLPEPALGINFARDGMPKEDWLLLVAVHSDSWLLAVAFYFVALFGKNERERLFQMINELPTLFEVVTATFEQWKDRGKSKSCATESRLFEPPQSSKMVAHFVTFACLLHCAGSIVAVAFWPFLQEFRA